MAQATGPNQILVNTTTPVLAGSATSSNVNFAADTQFAADLALYETRVELYGAYPGAPASVMNTAWKNALKAGNGGLVSLTTPGTYLQSVTQTPQSNTDILIGRGVIVKADAAMNDNLFRNANWGATDGSAWIAITSITAAAGVVGLGTVATVTTTNAHGLSTGNSVLINGANPDEYNGVFVITVTSTTTFTYLLDRTHLTTNVPGAATFLSSQFTGTTAAATATVTSMGGSAGAWAATTCSTTNGSATITSVTSTTNWQNGMYIAGNGIPYGTTVVSFVANTSAVLSNKCYVTGAGVTITPSPGIFPGMVVTGTGVPANTFIQTYDSATQVTLNQNCTGANAGLTASFPLRCMLADTNIRFYGGGTLDGNAANQTAGDSWRYDVINFRAVGNCTFEDITIQNYGVGSIRCVGAYNVLYRNLRVYGGTTTSSNGLYPVAGCGRNVIVQNLFGSCHDDFISVIQKEYSQYTDAGWPMGPITQFTVDNANPEGCLSIIKNLPAPGLLMDDISLTRMRGRASTTGFLSLSTYDPTNTGAYNHGATGVINSIRTHDCEMANNPDARMVAFSANCLSWIGEDMRGFGINTGEFIRLAANVELRYYSLTDTELTGTSTLVGNFQGWCKEHSWQGLRGTGGLQSIIRLQTGSPNNVNIRATNVVMDGCGYLLNVNGMTGCTLRLTNVEVLNATTALINSSNASSQVFVTFAGCDITDSLAFSGTWSNPVSVWDGGATRATSQNAESGTFSAGATPSLTQDILRNPRKICTLNGNAATTATYNNMTNQNAGFPLGHQLFIQFVWDNTTNNYTLAFGANFVLNATITQHGAAADTKRTEFVFVHDGTGKWVWEGPTNVWH